MSALHTWLRLPDGTFLRKNLTTHSLEIYASNGSTLLHSTGGGGVPMWTTGTSYAVNAHVNSGDRLYRCITGHTAGATFAANSANWVEVGAPRLARVWYEHASIVGNTYTAGTRATFVALRSINNTTQITLNGATNLITLAANTGWYKVTVWADTEGPAAGDATTVSVLVDGVTWSNFNVTEPDHQTGSWLDVLDTTGAPVTVEVNRLSVTGTGRLDVKVEVEQLGTS